MEVTFAHRLFARMMRPHVRDVRLVVWYADNAPDDARHAAGDAENVVGVGGRARGGSGHGLALLPLGPMVRSKCAKMRPYSSVQLDGRTKP